MLRAFKYALDPNAVQTDAFHSHSGGTRYAYNWAVARVRANWEQRRAEASYGIPEADRTPWVSTTAISLNNEFNRVKDEVAPWNRENSSRIYNTAFVNAARAFVNLRSGRARFPRFKSKRDAPSFQMAAGVALVGRRHIRLTRIGDVHTCQSTRRLARLVEAGKAKIKTCTVSRQGERWFIAILAETPDIVAPNRPGDRVVGVDFGISHLATLSTGDHVANPRHLTGDLRELRRAQRVASRRRGPDRRTKTEPSNRWRKANRRVRRIHTRIRNRRAWHLHQVSADLIRRYDTVVIEDLAVRNMLRNRRLSRHISEASWGELRRQLTYKAEWYGARLLVADRWYPSSKTCSLCGAVKTKLALSTRTFTCNCGAVLDRDVNAARNLAALAGLAAAPSDHGATGGLRREQPDGTARKSSPGSPGTQRRLPREERGLVASLNSAP